MRIVLCDDEPGYRRLIYDKILQDGFVHDYEVEVAEYGGGRELLEALDRGEYADYSPSRDTSLRVLTLLSRYRIFLLSRHTAFFFVSRQRQYGQVGAAVAGTGFFVAAFYLDSIFSLIMETMGKAHNLPYIYQKTPVAPQEALPQILLNLVQAAVKTVLPLQRYQSVFPLTIVVRE